MRRSRAPDVKTDLPFPVDEFKQEIGDDPPEVSVVRFLPGETHIYQKESFIGTVLEDTRLPRPPSQDVEDFAILEASKESIPDMGGDVIFVTAYGAEEETTLEEITSDPLWQKLEAVQRDRVYEVSDDLWMLGIGYTAAGGVVDDLTKYPQVVRLQKVEVEEQVADAQSDDRLQDTVDDGVETHPQKVRHPARRARENYSMVPSHHSQLTLSEST